MFYCNMRKGSGNEGAFIFFERVFDTIDDQRRVLAKVGQQKVHSVAGDVDVLVGENFVYDVMRGVSDAAWACPLWRCPRTPSVCPGLRTKWTLS